MADRHTLTLHLGANSSQKLCDVLHDIATEASDFGFPSDRIAAGNGYSYRLSVGAGHDLEERAASVLGDAAIGSPLGDLAAALDEVERLRTMCLDAAAFLDDLDTASGDTMAARLRDAGGARG